MDSRHFKLAGLTIIWIVLRYFLDILSLLWVAFCVWWFMVAGLNSSPGDDSYGMFAALFMLPIGFALGLTVIGVSLFDKKHLGKKRLFFRIFVSLLNMGGIFFVISLAYTIWSNIY
jgi:hypothetical protein